MNNSTKLFLENLDNGCDTGGDTGGDTGCNRISLKFIKNVKHVYKKFIEYDTKKIEIDTVKAIFNEIEKCMYKEGFYRFLETYPKIRSKINFVNNKNKLKNIGAFCDTIRYGKRHVEYDKYDVGFNIELDAINSLDHSVIYYSGGYITKSRVIFIILILVHESIHIIEYKDSYLCDSNDIHSLFFYKYGYRLFGLLTRLSEVFMNNRVDLLFFDTKEREYNLRYSVCKNHKRNINAENLINDHSHYMQNKKEVLLGYITYGIFKKNGIVFLENL